MLGFLFGSPLNLTWTSVAAVVALSLVVLVIVLALYGPLVAIAFDEEAARVSGLPTDGLVLTLTLVVALMVVGGMYAIGLLLVSAMMIVPVAAAAQLTSSYRETMGVSAVIGAASAVIGLTLSVYADATPGSSIVLVAIAAYVIAAVISSARRRGADNADPRVAA